MKKLLALMLTALMLLSSVSLTAVASEILDPVSIYAGARTVTAEYSADVTEEAIGDVNITTYEGDSVEFTKKINGRFLTIIANEEFVRDTQDYILQIGNTKKVFNVKTLYKPEFVANTENNTVSGLTFGKGNGVVVDVIDKNTIIAGVNEGSIGLEYDDIKNYENASIVADVYYTGDAHSKANGVFVFNSSSKAPTYAFTYKGAGTIARAYWFLKETSARYYDRTVMVTDGSGMKDFPGYDSANPIHTITPMTDADTKVSILQNNYGSVYTGSAITVGTTTLPEDFETNANKYRYVIDKMGAVGTFMMNDTFVDIMDSQDYYDAYNTVNNTSLTAPTKGYFVITPTASNFRMILSNVAFITSDMRDFASGDLTATAKTDGNYIIVSFAGAEGMNLSSVKVEDYITLSDGLTYNVVSKVENEVVISVNNPEYGKDYTVTVKEGFGYENLTVKEEQILTVQFKGFAPKDVYAGQDAIIVKLSEAEEGEVLPERKAELIKITRTDTGAVVPFSNKISGDILTIMPEESFVINEADAQTKVSYILDLGDVKKIFTVNKLWEDKLDTAASTATADTGLKNSSEAKAVVDGKLIYDGVASSIFNGTAVYPDEATYINKENVSFSAKVQFLNKFPSYNFMFNMSTEFTQPYNSGWNSFIGFGFHTYYGQSASQWYDKYTHTNRPVYNYYEKVSEENIINSKTFLPAYSGNASTAVLNSKPLIELSAEVAASASKNKWTDASYVVTDEMKDKNIFELTIDKMGSVATLVQEGKLFDTSITSTRNLVTVYDTADEFVTVAALNGRTAPTTGRFGIATYGGNTVMAFYDMVLTETEMRDVASGEITVEEITTLKDTATITLSAGSVQLDVSNFDIEKFIDIEGLSYNVISKEGNKIVVEVLNPDYTREYNVTVKAGLGYEDLTVKTDHTTAVKFTEVKPVDIYAGVATITAKYNTDMTQFPLDEIVIKDEDGNVISYTTSVKKNIVTIKPEDNFELDKIYELKIGNKVHNAFRITKVWEPEYIDTDSDGKIDDVGENTTITAESLTDSPNGYYSVTADKKIVLVKKGGQNNGRIYLRPSIDTNNEKYKNLSLTYDVQHLDVKEATAWDRYSADTLFFNATSAAETIFNDGAHNAKNGMSIFGWSTWNDSWVKRRLYKVFDKEAALYAHKGLSKVGDSELTDDKAFLTTDVKYSIPKSAGYSDFTYDSANAVPRGENQNEEKVSLVLPEDFNTKYAPINCVLDKAGVVGTYVVNDAVVDVYNTQDAFADAGAECAAPEFGYVGIGARSYNNVVLSNIMLTQTEMVPYSADAFASIEIIDVTYLNANGETLESINGAATVKGVATVKNGFSIEKPIKLIAIAYAGDEMLDVSVLEVSNMIGPMATASAEYSFSGLSGLTEIKVVAWDSFANLFPYTSAFVKY